jgi:hypothetical protein
MEFTFETFNNPLNDNELTNHIEETCRSVKIDPAKIRDLAASSEISKLKIRSHAEAQFESALAAEKVLLNGWIENSDAHLARFKKEELRIDEEIKHLRATKRPEIGAEVLDISPHVKNKIWLTRGISIVALIVGCFTTFGLLTNEMQWTWFLAAPASLLAVFVIGGAIKVFFNLLAEQGLTNWKIAFYVVFGILVISGFTFFYFLSKETGDRVFIITRGGNETNKEFITQWRFFFGIVCEILAASLAWAYSDKLIRDCIRKTGIIKNPELEALESEKENILSSINLWSSRITLAKSLIKTIQSADANLQADAERIFEEVLKKA